MTEEIFKYILKNFESVYRTEHGDFNINYGIDKKSRIQIKKGNVNYFSGREPLDLSVLIWKEWKGEKIPFLFDSDQVEIIDIQSENQVIINYDLIASAFYFLSNWQEYVSEDKDIYGRFRLTESIQSKLNFICKPVVNYYFDILKYAIEKAYNIMLNQRFWQGRKMAVCLTHDVDLCESAWLQGSFRELLKGNFMAPLKLIAAKLFSTDEWFNFSEIVEIEKNFNANSTFFFLTFKGRKKGTPHADYNISESKFRNVFKLIKENGSEIALHGSMGTSANAENLKSEINKFGTGIHGNRFHFLKYDSFISPCVISESGLNYDSTLGFAEAIGFRNSYCLPFYLFDIKNKRSTNILEIPLTVMDVSFSEKYMGIKKEEALIKICELVNVVEKFNGCLTLLWHNTSFSEYKYTGWKNIYLKVLGYCAGKDALMTSGENIFNLFVTPE